MKTMKSFAVLFAVVTGILFVTGCGPASPVKNPAKKLAVSVKTADQNLTTYSGQTLNFELNVTGGVAPYRYNWSENGQTFSTEAAPSYLIGDETPLGEHNITVTVTDSENAEANATISFTVVQDPNRFKAVEEFFGLSDLKVGDSWYYDGEKYVMTEDACQWDTHIDSEGKKEWDVTTFVLSGKKLHFTLGNTEVDGDFLLGCSENTYVTSDPYNDMMIIDLESGGLNIIGMSNHSNPNDGRWVHTNEPLLNSKIIYE